MLFAAIYAIIVGLGMIGQWAFSYYSKQIPELETEPVRIGFHLAAEGATALLLIVSGSGLLAGTTWGRAAFLVAMGMLFYTAIVSPGYFAQKGQWGWLGMFAAILVLGAVSLAMVF